MGERSTKSTASTTSSMKGKNRKQIEHSPKQERPRLIFWFFFFIRLANQLIIVFNLVSCALKGLSFVHLLRNLLNTFAIVCYWFVIPEPGAL